MLNVHGQTRLPIARVASGLWHVNQTRVKPGTNNPFKLSAY